MRSGFYYHLDSNGDVDTNLQLYSLIAAGKEWASLKIDFSLQDERAPYYHSRCCHVVMLCGASVAQLAGQNDPKPADKLTASPDALITKLADEHEAIKEIQGRLSDLIRHYDGVRHFGLTGNGIGHHRVTEINFEVARECVETTRAFWKAMIACFAEEPDMERIVRIDTLLPA